MKRRFPFNLWEFIAALGFFAAMYGSLCLYLYFQKPLFVNDFGYCEKTGIIPCWSVDRSDVRDDSGNRFIADFRKNLLVIVQVPTERHPPVVPGNGNVAKIILPDEKSVEIEVGQNFLIWIHPDGNINSKPLAAGRAEELFKAVKESELPNRMSLITEE